MSARVQAMTTRRAARRAIRRADLLDVIAYLEDSVVRANEERLRDSNDERHGHGYPRMCGRLEGSIEIAVKRLREAAGS